MRSMTLSSLMALLLLLLLSICSAAPNYMELYEGSKCRMEDGSDGECVQLPKCPKRIQEVKEGRRFSNSAGRCSFDNFVEIVCCPLSESNGNVPVTSSQPVMPFTRPATTTTTTPVPIWTMPEPISTTEEITYDINDDIGSKLGRRPADVACEEIETKTTGITRDLEVNPWIFEGVNATKGEFPHMVALGYKKNPENPKQLQYICGGTLISLRHVLTAAHCVRNINNNVPTEVKLGTINLDDKADDVQNIKVSEIIAHPNYKSSMNYNDIAILKLEKSAVKTQYVKPICLQTTPVPNLHNLVNNSLIVTGWGATSFEDDNSNTLQKTPSMQLVQRLDCNKFYNNNKKLPRGIDEGMICLWDKNLTRRSDSCQGDSGGPLQLGTRVIGVTSFGQSCGGPIPAIYTNVFFYLDWIEEVVWPERKRALRRT